MKKTTAPTIYLALGALCAVFSPIAAQTPEPVSPGSTGEVLRVAATCPTFSWGSLPSAERHDLIVYQLSEMSAIDPGAIDIALSPDAELISQIELPGSASSWTPSADLCLTPGETYAWTIRSYSSELTTEWAEARLFAVERSEVSDLEAALERVINRYLQDRKINEQTAVMLVDDPSLLTSASTEEALSGPVQRAHVDLEPDQTAVYGELLGADPRMVAVYGVTDGKDGSAGVRGDATASVGVQTHGVVGLTSGDLADSAGVLGQSKNTTSTQPKFGVLGISSDSNAESAGVSGRGTTGVIEFCVSSLSVPRLPRYSVPDRERW